MIEIADTLSLQKGQLESVCNCWIYKCLWFGLDQKEQESSGFKFKYSIEGIYKIYLS
jgi:hypothetical protein